MFNTSELSAFQKVQVAFAANIRNPQQQPCPQDVEPRRMAIYQELLYNNVEGFMSHSFPLLRQLYDDNKWHAMIRDYFATHRAVTPMFPEMPREFIKYLQHERTPQPDDPPYLFELAHYDWQELALDIADIQIDLQGIDSNGNLLNAIPVLSPLVKLDAYQFPVHRITPEFQPTQPDATPSFILRYRDRTDAVHTLEVNAVTAMLINQLAEFPEWTGQEHLSRIAERLQHPYPELVIQHGREILEDLLKREVILGTRQD